MDWTSIQQYLDRIREKKRFRRKVEKLKTQIKALHTGTIKSISRIPRIALTSKTTIVSLQRALV